MRPQLKAIRTLPAASPKDVNSSGEAAFDEFEKELSQKQVTVLGTRSNLVNRAMFGIK